MMNSKLRKLKRTDEIFPWVWAIRSQICLLEANDARWIRDASVGWPKEERFHNFLTSYSLVRGKKGSCLSKEPDRGQEVILKPAAKKLLSLCKKYYAPQLPKKNFIGEVSVRWKTVDQRLREYVLRRKDLSSETRHLIDKKSDFLPSATLKAFWFYHPEKLTMYDSLNCIGLKKEMSVTNLTPENFLEEFYNFYERHKDNIAAAESYTDRSYPYPYRLADKYLWLMGNNSKDFILDNFEASLELEYGPR